MKEIVLVSFGKDFGTAYHFFALFTTVNSLYTIYFQIAIGKNPKFLLQEGFQPTQRGTSQDLRTEIVTKTTGGVTKL